MHTRLATFVVLAGLAVQWPLDLSHRYLTSNFMEYREGRFHAGLDLKTNSQTGYPCRAVEDGWISRVRVGAWGYGQAVYLQGASGRSYVYGHVERLADPLRARVRAAQARQGRYPVDLELPAGAEPVKKGQVIALSGQTGTGGPHLHFEVRDDAGRPVDPLAAGFPVPDRFPPRILTLRAVPATPEALILGKPVAHVAAPAGGRAPALAVRGPVAFSADVVEISDAMNNKLAPWRLALTLDGTPVFETRNDMIDWPSVGDIRLEFLDCGGVRERWLHRRLGNEAPGRSGGEWYLHVAPGRHELELTAEDRAGNASRLRWTLQVLADGEAWPAPAAGWKASPTGVTFAGDDALIPPLGAPHTPPPGDRVRAPFDLWWRETSAPVPSLASGLVVAGPAAEYAAADWTASEPLTVPSPRGADAFADDPRAGVYRRAGGAWGYVGPAGGFALRRPGLYAVLRDTLGPVIVVKAPVVTASAGPVRVAPEVTPPRWARLAISLGDHGSGLDWDRLLTWLDGAKFVVEPDAPRQRLLVELPDDIPSGDHTLGIEAWDLAGNLSTRTFTVRVPR
jgi:hypothetical protein